MILFTKKLFTPGEDFPGVFFFKNDIIESIKNFKRQKKRHTRFILNSFFKIYILNIISFKSVPSGTTIRSILSSTIHVV